MFLTEDKITDWVDSAGGLLITRRICNVQTYNFINHTGLQYVCLTGYSQIIHQFFQEVIDKFSSKIVLIIIESDVVELSQEWLDHPKLMHCFTWNKPFYHRNLSALPIGLNYNRQYDALTKWLGQQSIDTIADKQWVCMNYSPSTDPSRVKLIERAKNKWKNFCTIIDFIPNACVYVIPSHIEGQITVSVTNPECYSQWSKYKFVISPRGAGEDCHRTWEALHIGCIPIVLSSKLNELYHDLPILVVDSWDDITLPLLQSSYRNIQKRQMENGYCMEKITLQYWIERFKKSSLPSRKIHFITYANDVFKQAKQRLLMEAHEFGEFTTINGYGPEHLSHEFQTKHKYILDMKRGGGYWIWRPHILRKALDNIKKNEYLVYLDAGCKLNLYGKKRFYEYFDLLDNSPYGILSFQMSGKNGLGSLQMEKMWTTKEIFNVIDIDMNSQYAEEGQYLGGVLIMKKTQHLMNYISEFEKIIDTNSLLCTDFYNNTEQCKDFTENRHEQSVSSLLRKTMGSVVIDGDESWIPPFGRGESLKYPFWATRSKI
jgi:hypothetical protein